MTIQLVTWTMSEEEVFRAERDLDLMEMGHSSFFVEEEELNITEEDVEEAFERILSRD